MGTALTRVLVVDDETNYARVMAIGLRVEGFDVDTTPTADGALDALAAEPFDLAIVDLMMPGTNGIQLARLMRERHPRTQRRADERLSPERAAARPSRLWRGGFVPKPFDLTELARFLRAKLASTGGVGPFDARGAAA